MSALCGWLDPPLAARARIRYGAIRLHFNLDHTGISMSGFPEGVCPDDGLGSVRGILLGTSLGLLLWCAMFGAFMR